MREVVSLPPCYHRHPSARPLRGPLQSFSSGVPDQKGQIGLHIRTDFMDLTHYVNFFILRTRTELVEK